MEKKNDWKDRNGETALGILENSGILKKVDNNIQEASLYELFIYYNNIWEHTKKNIQIEVSAIWKILDSK